MTTRSLAGLILCGALTATVAPACGSAGNNGNAGGASGSSSSHHTSRSSATSGAGGGGGAGDFDSAIPITIEPKVITGKLPDPATSRDYYRFAGKKGQVVGVRVRAQTLLPGGSGFDPTVIDPVITIFDPHQKQFAHEDNPWHETSRDPLIRTILPEDGDYYILVEDCNSASPGQCDDPSKINVFDYDLTVDLASGTSINAERPEPDDKAKTATPLIFPPNPAGGYDDAYNYGTFAGGSDVDAFSVKLPSDIGVPAGTRARVKLWIQPGGVNGNGSTTSVGLVWIVDPSDPSGKHLAELDDTFFGQEPRSANPPAELTAPLALNKQYYLFVQHPSKPAGKNDFYFFTSWEHGGGPVEVEEAANNLPATAEPLTPVDNMDGTFALAIEGDLDVAGNDVDNFAIPLPAGPTKVDVACFAQREGSGLRGLKTSVLKGDGTTIASITEAADHFAPLQSVVIPAGAKKLILQVRPSAQDPEISGAYYRCSGSLHK